MKALLARQNYLAIALLAADVVLISVPVYTYRIMNPTENDYGTHIQFALDLLGSKPVPSYTLAHPVQQILLIGMLWISRGKIDFWAGSILIQVTAQLFTALILYFWFGRLPGRWGEARRAFWAVSLTVVAPVIALAAVDGRYYYGYIGLANYHNPTVHLLRPLALVSFFLALRALEGQRSPLWLSLFSAAVIVFSALIKPNYALCILPALGLLAALRWLRNQPVDWWLVIGGFFAPACLSLAAQGVLTYADGGGVIFNPLAVEASYSANLLPKFLLSILFPLLVLLVYFPAVRGDQELILAWVVFCAGALQMYLFAEGGDRFYHANFRWGAQISLFLLFAAAARFLVHCTPLPGGAGWKSRLPVLGAYLLHLAAGVVYYLHVMTSKGYG